MMRPTDTKIIQYIRNNARTSLTDISKQTGIPISTIFDRLRIQEKFLVKKFTALIDFTRLGYPIRANILLKVTPQDREGLKEFLLIHERVNNIYRINNGFDYATECIFASIKDSEEFVEKLELQFEIQDKKIFHVIDDIAREKMLALRD